MTPLERFAVEEATAASVNAVLRMKVFLPESGDQC